MNNRLTTDSCSGWGINQGCHFIEFTEHVKRLVLRSTSNIPGGFLLSLRVLSDDRLRAGRGTL